MAPPPIASTRNRHFTRWLRIPVLALAACSVVPEPTLAPCVECRVRVHYTLGTDATIDAPASSSELTILDLVCAPLPTQERFAGAQRRLHFAEGVREVVLCCHYRAYEGSSRELFPGASRIEWLP